MKWESCSSEKVPAMEGNLFWKGGFSNKEAFQEK